MTRLLPLVPLMLWLTWADETRAVPPTISAGDWAALLYLLCGVLGIVATMALWARLLLRAYRYSYEPMPTRTFHYAMLIARVAMIAWYGVCLYELRFGTLVDEWLWPLAPWQVRVPGLIAATWPVLLGWFGLWWAAYPVERATREQNLLAEIDSGITPRAPPGLRQTLGSNFRMQVLFAVAPVLAVAGIRDVAAVGLHLVHLRLTDTAESILFVGSIVLVFVASPELLIRVLRARPLAPSPLRVRLDVMARQLGLRYRDILIWHTSHGIGNAAVMGIVPRFRYILLTDLLIETLDDRQLEAVFAHEAGHVRHRHLLWYVAFWGMCVLCLSGPGNAMLRLACRLAGVTQDAGWPAASLVISIGIAGVFLMLFGVLSRLFEKQADVYAARAIQSLERPLDPLNDAPLATPVGSVGAESFVSALRRVAEINRMPWRRVPRPRNLFAAGAGHLFDVALNFMHPSIPDRVDHLRYLALDATRTARFDRRLVLVMLGLLFALAVLATWTVFEAMR